MAEALEIPRMLDERVKVKKRESGYTESEHILALATNAFGGGDYLEDLEALGGHLKSGDRSSAQQLHSLSMTGWVSMEGLLLLEGGLIEET